MSLLGSELHAEAGSQRGVPRGGTGGVASPKSRDVPSAKNPPSADGTHSPDGMPSVNDTPTTDGTDPTKYIANMNSPSDFRVQPVYQSIVWITLRLPC